MSEQVKVKRSLADVAFRLSGVVVIVLSLVIAWFSMDFKAFRQNPLSIPESGMALMVKPGSTLKSISADLKQQQVLDKPLYLVLLARYLDLRAQHYEETGHLIEWLDQEIGSIEDRLNWLREFSDRLVV